MTDYVAELCESIRDLPEGLGTTYALVVVRAGETVYEGYNGTLPGSNRVVDAATPLLSWSMAKSVLQLLMGIAHDDGLLDVDQPAAVPEWQEPNDPRRNITIRHLLQMRSGLQWIEDYSPDQPSNVIDMLFGPGKADVAGYAASMPLAAEPGSTWLYSSGTTNILSRILRDALRAVGTTTLAFLNDRLLVPCGIAEVTPKTAVHDEQGTWIGSSFLYLTATEWTKLGRLMLANGSWNGVEVVSPRWIAEARQVLEPCTGTAGEQYGYSHHWWLWPSNSATPDAFAAHGYEGQHVIVVPSKELVVVRLGSTPDTNKHLVRSALHRLIEAV
jgi:CubicO group peptidase (beta-lactamase class C family)